MFGIELPLFFTTIVLVLLVWSFFENYIYASNEIQFVAVLLTFVTIGVWIGWALT